MKFIYKKCLTNFHTNNYKEEKELVIFSNDYNNQSLETLLFFVFPPPTLSNLVNYR